MGFSFFSLWISTGLDSYAVLAFGLGGGGALSTIVVVGVKHYYGWTWPGVELYRIGLGGFVFVQGAAAASLLYVLPSFRDPGLHGMCALMAVMMTFFGLNLFNLLELQGPEYWKHCERVSEDAE